MLFVRLDANFQDDDRLVDVSAEAELVFIRSLAIAKRLACDGRIRRGHLRRLCDKLECDPHATAKELVEAGLWHPIDDGWFIPSWLKWNMSAEEIDETRAGKSAGGKRGNHKRWKHSGPFERCKKCHSSEGQSDTDRISDSLTDRMRSPETETETETETEKKTRSTSTDVEPRASPTFPDDVHSLTRRLAERIKANGHKLPAKGSKARDNWLLAVDRLLRIDEADPDEVAQVIDWATEPGSFWAPNIQSAQTFRQRYSQLRGQMNRNGSNELPRGVREHMAYNNKLRQTQEALRAQGKGSEQVPPLPALGKGPNQ